MPACTSVPSKSLESIIKGIFTHWISAYSPAKQFLTDNGGEFVNEDFVTLCESFNVIVQTTGAEAPQSNGLVDCHNLVLSDMLDKVLEDSHCDFDVALTWCLIAKNSLQNVHGFSPYQLALGQNPVLPAILSDKLPALIPTPVSNIIRLTSTLSMQPGLPSLKVNGLSDFVRLYRTTFASTVILPS